VETDLHSATVGLSTPPGRPIAVPSLYRAPVTPPRSDTVRTARTPGPHSARWVLEWVAVVVVALLLAVGVRTWVAQMFFIPSGSMLPTLQIGDRIIVDKLSYHLHGVDRGDVVVFRRPPLEQADYSDLVKRVIGLPGDTISSVGGRVYIDGQPLNEPWLPTPEPATTPSPLPDGFSLNHPYTVPADEYFVMGDNRTDSEDSRYFGPIPKNLIVGKLVMVVWPLDDNGWLAVLVVLAVALVVAIAMVALQSPAATRPSRGANPRGPPVPGTL
jgi:signal peptidase I